MYRRTRDRQTTSYNDCKMPTTTQLFAEFRW